MSEKKIVVPDGMLTAVWKVVGAKMKKHIEEGQSGHVAQLHVARIAVEAALLWLIENPILPTSEQLYSTISKLHVAMCDIVWTERDRAMIAEWQRRMFLAPEPEVPEDIKDAIRSIAQGRTLTPAEADYIMDQVSRVAHGWTPKVSR